MCKNFGSRGLLALMLISATTSVKRTAQSQSLYQTTCKPMRILLIWHTSSEENNYFFRQKGFITKLITYLPDGTGIYLTTIDVSSTNRTYFKKDSANSSWINRVDLQRPGNSGNYIMPNLVISKAVYNFLNQIENKKIANQVILVVNKESRVQSKKKLKQALKKKVVFVVVTGKKPPPEIWISVATDKNHITTLDDVVARNVTPSADRIVSMCCQDSRLICDTDQFWTGKICYRCSYTCSTTKYPSEKCLHECPYYYKRNSTDSHLADANNQCESRWFYQTVPGSICLGLVVQVLCFIFYLRQKQNQVTKRHSDTENHSQDIELPLCKERNDQDQQKNRQKTQRKS